MIVPRVLGRTASRVVVLAVGAGLWACRVATQENNLYGDDQASSAPISVTRAAELGDAGDASPPPDASDASTDGNAGPTVLPPCTPETMDPSAPSTTCAEDSIVESGGTPTVGRYTLSRWADGAKSCSSYVPRRQGTMNVEDVSGTLFMRWILDVDGRTSSGTYQLTPRPNASPPSFTRSEVCNATANDPTTTTTVGYTATPSEIRFFYDSGQERWTLVPKVAPNGGAPNVDPVISGG